MRRALCALLLSACSPTASPQPAAPVTAAPPPAAITEPIASSKPAASESGGSIRATTAMKMDGNLVPQTVVDAVNERKESLSACVPGSARPTWWSGA